MSTIRYAGQYGIQHTSLDPMTSPVLNFAPDHVKAAWTRALEIEAELSTANAEARSASAAFHADKAARERNERRGLDQLPAEDAEILSKAMNATSYRVRTLTDALTAARNKYAQLATAARAEIGEVAVQGFEAAAIARRDAWQAYLAADSEYNALFVLAGMGVTNDADGAALTRQHNGNVHDVAVVNQARGIISRRVQNYPNMAAIVARNAEQRAQQAAALDAEAAAHARRVEVEQALVETKLRLTREQNAAPEKPKRGAK